MCPDVIDDMLDLALREELAYCTNAEPGARTYPPGVDIEVYRTDLLERLASDEANPFFREFPFEYVRAKGQSMRWRSYRGAEDYSALHLTVDYPEDLAAANAIYRVLHRPGQPFRFGELMAALRAQPGLAGLFSGKARNQEYFLKRQSLNGAPTA